MVQGQSSGGGLGDEVPQKLKGRGGVSPHHWSVWEKSGEGAVPPSQNFFLNFYLKMVSFGAFWVALYAIYLLIY